MKLKPSKSYYFISIAFLFVGFVLMIVLASNLITKQSEGIMDVTFSYQEIEVAKDDMILVYVDKSEVILIVEECEDNVACVNTLRGTIEITVDPALPLSRYDFVEPYQIDSFHTEEHECAFGIYANEDITLRFKKELGSNQNLYISTFTYNDYSTFGFIIFAAIGLGIIGSLVSFGIVYSKRARFKRENKENPVSLEQNDEYNLEDNYYIKKEEKTIPKDYNDF